MNEGKQQNGTGVHTQKPPKGAPVGVPVSDVTVVIGYTDRDGKRQEVIHDIANVQIIGCHHQVEEKVQKIKDEDGRFAGFEPTGENILTIKVKYLKG